VKCFLLHSWDAWEAVIEERLVIGKEIWVRRYQHRECYECGLVQERETAKVRVE